MLVFNLQQTSLDRLFSLLFLTQFFNFLVPSIPQFPFVVTTI